MIQGIANFQGVNHMFDQDCRLLLVFVEGQHSRLNSTAPCFLGKETENEWLMFCTAWSIAGNEN